MGKAVSMTHAELVERASKWLSTYNGKAGDYRCGVVLSEYSCMSGEIPDVIGFSSNKSSVLIECKISKSDFKADQYKYHRHSIQRLGNLRYYLVPAGLITSEETPEGWGLLYAYANKISIIRKAELHKELEIKQAEYYILYSLVRRATIRGYLPSLCKPLETEVSN